MAARVAIVWEALGAGERRVGVDREGPAEGVNVLQGEAAQQQAGGPCGQRFRGGRVLPADLSRQGVGTELRDRQWPVDPRATEVLQVHARQRSAPKCCGTHGVRVRTW